MAEATQAQIDEALDAWVTIQSKQPGWIAGYVKLNGNPFVPSPADEGAINRFLQLAKAESSTLVGTDTIDPKLREQLVEEYREGSQKAKSARSAAELSAKKRFEDIFKSTLERSDVDPKQKPLLFRETKVQADDDPNLTVAEAETKAVAILEKAQPFFQKKIEVEVAVKNQSLFSKLQGRNAVQQAISPIADAVITVFPGLRQGVLNKNLEEKLGKLLDAPNTLIDYLGIKAVDQVGFKQMIHGAQTELSRTGPSAGPGNFLSGLTSWVFGSSLDRTATEGVRAYWEIYRINVMQGLPPPDANQFLASGMGIGSSAFRFALNEAKGFAIKKGLIAAGGEALAAALGGPPGWIAGLLAIGGGLLGKIGGGLMNLTGLKPGKVSGDQTLVGLGCGALIAVFILMLLAVGAINDSLNIHLGLGGQSSSEVGSIIDCSQTPNDPQCKFTACTGDCQWPASGIITQGPFTGGFCGNPAQTSHDVGNAANGIDIASSDGGPVYTPRAGTVMEAYTQCANNSGKVGNTCGGSPAFAGYGNHVILKTDDGYTLIFGHMENAMNVQAGQHVDAGAQLGWMDQTGNSTGTHLHFGVLSGGSVLDFVPKNDPSHAPGDISGCVDGESSCKKTCPYAPVTAGK